MPFPTSVPYLVSSQAHLGASSQGKTRLCTRNKPRRTNPPSWLCQSLLMQQGPYYLLICVICAQLSWERADTSFSSFWEDVFLSHRRFLQCYRGEGGSPLSLSSSASPGFCTIKQLPCSTSELLATQQKKRKKRKTGEKKGGLAEEKVDKYHKTLEKTDRPPLVNSCALLWHRPH